MLEHNFSLQKKNKLLESFENILADENINADIVDDYNAIYLPLSAWLANKHINNSIVIGITGAQGSGKTTLNKILCALLTNGFNKKVISLSIDDLYLSREKRKQLAKKIHPLLETRGVPGTHDIELGIKIFEQLLNKKIKKNTKLPVFDKSIDDLLPESQWRIINKTPDIILFEGWCLGASAQIDKDLEHAINSLEENEDPQCIWRKYVNQQIKGPYKKLFDFIDYQILLEVPDMKHVFEWRSLQEQKLAAQYNKNNLLKSSVMSNEELTRFIMHYERITRSSLLDMPKHADIVLKLNNNHRVDKVVLNFVCHADNI